MNHRPRHHARVPRYLDPLRVGRVTARTQRLRLPDPHRADPASRDEQPSLGDTIPERLRVAVPDRLRRQAHQGSLDTTSAPVGTTLPPVTTQCVAPSTCDVEVPRIWRAPSTIRLNPCTYASLKPPPLVLYGGFAPDARYAVPSPSSQKPNSWKNSGI